MLGCDECGDWYHLRCAQVTANFARTAKHYVCQACRAAKGDVFKLHRPDASTHRHIHRTRRPSLASLGELLLEAMDFVGEAPEEALIAEVFREHARWRRAVKAAKARRESIVGVETAARAAKEAWEAAEALAAVPRDARRARIQEVSDRAAAVQHAQLLAGTTAMAAALLGAGGQGTAATALEATQRDRPRRVGLGDVRRLLATPVTRPSDRSREHEHCERREQDPGRRRCGERTAR